jgi:protein required for attachment to host cells
LKNSKELFKSKEQPMTSRKAILVANSYMARLFERSSVQSPWVETQDWVHSESRMRAQDTERSPLGHSLAGRTGLAPHTEIRDRERMAFAHDVAADLKRSLAIDKWEELEVFASDPFLGQLLAHLSPDVQKIVCTTHVLDWTSLPAHEIEKRWRNAFSASSGRTI